MWHSFGHTHVCKPEDFPVMPVEYAGFMLKPNGFFAENPAMDLPPDRNGASRDNRGAGAAAADDLFTRGNERYKKEAGLGARWHREALFVFASVWDRVVSHAHPCEALSGLQQFNVEILSRLATAFPISRTI